VEQWEDYVRVENWVLIVLSKLMVQLYWKERMNGFEMRILITENKFK